MGFIPDGVCARTSSAWQVLPRPTVRLYVLSLPIRRAVAFLGALSAIALGSALDADVAAASKSQWSIFEDHAVLVGSTPRMRANALQEMRTLGADTLRVQVRWNEVAPRPRSKTKPSFDPTNPAAYPGFGPYDDLVRRADALGMRILATITGDAPRWATYRSRARSFRSANYRPSAREYGRFTAAVARRYSGEFQGLPKVRYFSLWNEPNHKQFLKPRSAAPRIYRELVYAGLTAIRRNGAAGARVFVGELAPVGRPGKVIGPGAFLQRWLCLTKRFRPRRRGDGCRRFEKIRADGFAHHPYGPVKRVSRRRDIINLLAIRRLGRYLDRAARARRLPRRLPIYSTEFGLQSNPPDDHVSTSPARQARLINEKEEYSYRYWRLKSYSQYLLYDDPPRSGRRSGRWSGFQTGLRYPKGGAKPAWNAYRFPIVVRRRRGGVTVWGRVRPGEGTHWVRLQRRGRRGYAHSGARIRTNSRGYFRVRRRRVASYRFQAYAQRPHGGRRLIGSSRTARPIH